MVCCESNLCLFSFILTCSLNTVQWLIRRPDEDGLSASLIKHWSSMKDYIKDVSVPQTFLFVQSSCSLPLWNSSIALFLFSFFNIDFLCMARLIPPYCFLFPVVFSSLLTFCFILSCSLNTVVIITCSYTTVLSRLYVWLFWFLHITVTSLCVLTCGFILFVHVVPSFTYKL